MLLPCRRLLLCNTYYKRSEGNKDQRPYTRLSVPSNILVPMDRRTMSIVSRHHAISHDIVSVR